MRTKKTSLNPKFYKDVERLILKKGWTKEALARNGRNQPVGPLHKLARCFCATGAIIKTADEWGIEPGPYIVHLGNMVRDLDDSYLGKLTLNRYNDQSELLDIRKLLQNAAKKVRKKP